VVGSVLGLHRGEELPERGARVATRLAQIGGSTRQVDQIRRLRVGPNRDETECEQNGRESRQVGDYGCAPRWIRSTAAAEPAVAETVENRAD
jgi:hypothetical protein